jgi:hypothetical protein
MVPFDAVEDEGEEAPHEATRQEEVGAVEAVLVLVVALLCANLV